MSLPIDQDPFRKDTRKRCVSCTQCLTCSEYRGDLFFMVEDIVKKVLSEQSNSRKPG